MKEMACGAGKQDALESLLQVSCLCWALDGSLSVCVCAYLITVLYLQLTPGPNLAVVE